MFESTARIDAPPAAVWAVLADLEAWPSWESAIVRTEGRLAEGTRIRLWTQIDPKRPFAFTVVALEPERRMVLESRWPLGLFRGVRTYELAPRDEGGTVFTMCEDYAGPFAPVLKVWMPKLQPSFDAFAKGLKVQAERRT